MKLLIFLHLKTPTKKLLAYQPALNKITLHEFCTWSLVVNLEPVKKSNHALPGGSLQHLAYQPALYKMTLHEFCTWSLVVNLEPMKKIKPCPACWQSSGRTSGSIPDLVSYTHNTFYFVCTLCRATSTLTGKMSQFNSRFIHRCLDKTHYTNKIGTHQCNAQKQSAIII